MKPIEWFLLTTRKIGSDADALDITRWYVLRWRIEDWRRVLKSECKVEDMAHRTLERLKRGLAINIVIAWRIMLMTLLGREAPELPAEILFSCLEIEVLDTFAKKKDLILLTVFRGQNRRTPVLECRIFSATGPMSTDRLNLLISGIRPE